MTQPTLKEQTLAFCETLAEAGYTTQEIASELHYLGEQELVRRPLKADKMAWPGPVHTHDCTECRFLGKIKLSDGVHDLYHCSKASLGGSLIARFSSDGPGYVSMPLSLVLDVLHTAPSDLPEPLYEAVLAYVEAEAAQRGELPYNVTNANVRLVGRWDMRDFELAFQAEREKCIGLSAGKSAQRLTSQMGEWLKVAYAQGQLRWALTLRTNTRRKTLDVFIVDDAGRVVLTTGLASVSP